jgi:hypothetical protein
MRHEFLTRRHHGNREADFDGCQQEAPAMFPVFGASLGSMQFRGTDEVHCNLHKSVLSNRRRDLNLEGLKKGNRIERKTIFHLSKEN